MIKSVLGSLAQLVAKPQVLLAGVIAGAFQLVLLMIAWSPALDFYEQVFVAGQFPGTGILELPFAFLQLYFPQLSIILIVMLAEIAIQFWISIVLGRFAKNSIEGKAGILEALGFGVLNFGKIAWAIVFLIAVGAVFFAAFGIIAWVLEFSIWLAIILFLLLTLALLYVYVRLVFFLPIMGAKEANVRDALLESWDFSRKKFWPILAFLVVIGVITGVLELAGTIASGFFAEDLIAGIVVAVFAVISATYSGLALANYYVMRESGSPKFYYAPRYKRRKK